jgi:hypothetical protein
MKRLVISVEGPTEREFVNRVLKPHLIARGWDVVKAISLNGGISLARIGKELRLLAQSKDFDAVTTLYDLYGFGDRDDRAAQTLEAAITSMMQSVGAASKVIAYVQQYEFEALVFADPHRVAAEFPRAKDGLQHMQQALAQCGAPEDINDGYETCPSRRLKKYFPSYDKVVHGALLTEKIGLDRIQQECPRFAQWLERLELARRAMPTH